MFSSAASLPGFDSPIELLLACHEKVRRFAGLCQRLEQHATLHGADEDAQAAAASVLRYFQIAAPLHHADEEEDLFPALRELGDASLTARIDELDAEHGHLAELWCCLQPWLEALSQGASHPAPPELSAFATRYPEHALREEHEVYPAAVRLSRERLAGIGLRMAQRRGAR
ncbi:hemerythrin domain-containing protein [Cupriavidus basilensis]|uniref:Hemerythrin domain-containing protein n=1 Tax=Cupriavidus basilensis TaxID=68895 RepID=A0ABT6AGP9_9BURK|nr:hemerythrin domain-containing protein [Cupriavidus basilensis]MDF3831775.1 hemerythrin domain-containing protein [Cupriavidus basilensis]